MAAMFPGTLACSSRLFVDAKGQAMNDRSKPTTTDEQPVAGAKEERVEPTRKRGPGVDGPIEKDRSDYKTHYGETAYGGGQKRYGGQPPVEDQCQGDIGRAEGKAGSKATLPGAGADRGPPDGK